MSWHCRAPHAALAALTLAAGTLAPHPAPAQPAAPNELVETFLHAKITDLGLLGIMFGVDDTAPLDFTRSIDLAARTFSYTLLPGQSYMGSPLSMQSAGFFDASIDAYRWSTAGTIGAEGWSTEGTLAWTGNTPFTAFRLGGPGPIAFGDPKKDGDEAKDDGSFEADAEDAAGRKYKVKGKAKKAANGTSTTEGTVTATDGGGGTSKFTGEDTWNPDTRTWSQRIKVEGTKFKGKDIPGPAIKSFNTAMLESGCDGLACGGSGFATATFEPEFATLPEPASVALLASGVLVMVGARAYRGHVTRRDDVA